MNNITLILGPQGIGKTTLAKRLAGVDGCFFYGSTDISYNTKFPKDAFFVFDEMTTDTFNALKEGLLKIGRQVIICSQDESLHIDGAYKYVLK